MKSKIRLSYRMELVGQGYYSRLADQYGSKYPELADKMRLFSRHEHKHSKLFAKLYSEMYGKQPGYEWIWRNIGKMAGFILRPLSLEKKLKRLSSVEKMAVKQIEKALQTGQEGGYFKVIKAILPDEERHAALYDEFITGEKVLKDGQS